MKTILCTTKFNNIGQVKKEKAQAEIDRLNKQENTNSWRADESDYMFVRNETDKYLHNPCERMEGYVWVTREPKQYSQEEVDQLLDQQAARTTAQVFKNKQFKEFDKEPDVFNLDNNAKFSVKELKEFSEDFARRVVNRGDNSDLTGFWSLCKERFYDKFKNDDSKVISDKQYNKREVANLLIEAMAAAVKNDRTENHIPIDEFSIDWIEKRLQM